MVKLLCAIVGDAESMFPVDINTTETVGDLKKAIKAEKSNDLKDVDADKLQLFLAKSTNGEWLKDEDPAALELQKRKIHQDIKKMLDGEMMMASKTLHHWLFDRNKMPQPSTDEIHVLVVVPKEAQRRKKLWAANGFVENALCVKSLRCHLYRLASLSIGFYDPARGTKDKDVAFWYEGNNLCFHILFTKDENAYKFQNDFDVGPVTLGSPLHGTTTNFYVDEIEGVSTKLKRVLYADYKPEESDSPQRTISFVSSSSNASKLEVSSDEYRYQRIEDERFFALFVRPEKCYMLSHMHCKRKREWKKYDDDLNNRLALSRDMHGYYNGIGCDIPIVNMLPGSVEERKSIDGRYKVEVLVKVPDMMCKDLVFLRLKDGSTMTDDPLLMKTFVYVKDPKIFCFCMNWKHQQIDQLWMDFLDMTPAID